MYDQMLCPACGTIGVPKSYRQGSLGVSILLLLVFFPAAIAYEVWRYIASPWVCPACGKGGMVSLATPVGKAALEKSEGQKVAGPNRAVRPAGYKGSTVMVMPEFAKQSSTKFKIMGVDRATKMDTTWYCDAESEANARAKADLEGIVVTSISPC